MCSPPGDTYIPDWTGLPLVRVESHYLNQCQSVPNRNIRNRLRLNSKSKYIRLLSKRMYSKCCLKIKILNRRSSSDGLTYIHICVNSGIKQWYYNKNQKLLKCWCTYFSKLGDTVFLTDETWCLVSSNLALLCGVMPKIKRSYVCVWLLATLNRIA